MRKEKNNMDEMQKQKLLSIEHNGLGFVFWALLAAILLQTLFFQDAVGYSITGEWIIFMCLCIYISFSCLKNGIWDRRLHPNGKTNLLISLGSGLACGLLFSISNYVNYHKPLSSIATGVLIFISVFVLTVAALTISVSLYKKRLEKMESSCDEP